MLIETSPSKFTVADGREMFAPRFLFDFVISVPASPHLGRGAFEVLTKAANRGPRVPECFELPLRPVPTDAHSPPAAHAPLAPFNSDDSVIFGMDLLHRWRVKVEGPERQYHLIVCPI